MARRDYSTGGNGCEYDTPFLVRFSWQLVDGVMQGAAYPFCKPSLPGDSSGLLGPLSIAVDATSFQTYTGGILTNCISQQVDHGVLAVGFDDAHNPPYWIIKNSWAASWGEDGYIRVEKGKDQCLITSYPCSAIVA